MIKILLVDDRDDIRRCLSRRLALEPDLVMVGEAMDGMEALRLATLLQPDVVVMDINMPGLDGIEATWALQPVSNSKVIILSIHDDGVTRAKALAAGAVAFVEKTHLPPLLDAIRQAIPCQAGLVQEKVEGLSNKIT